MRQKRWIPKSISRFYSFIARSNVWQPRPRSSVVYRIWRLGQTLFERCCLSMTTHAIHIEASLWHNTDQSSLFRSKDLSIIIKKTEILNHAASRNHWFPFLTTNNDIRHNFWQCYSSHIIRQCHDWNKKMLLSKVTGALDRPRSRVQGVCSLPRTSTNTQHDAHTPMPQFYIQCIYMNLSIQWWITTLWCRALKRGRKI